MGKDLVDRLRCNPCDCPGDCWTCQAADEIERLRAAGDWLANAVAVYCGDEAWANRTLKAWEVARRG